MYLQDQIKNEDILKLMIYSINDEIRHNLQTWKQPIGRIRDDRSIRHLINYKHQGKRDISRLRKIAG